MAKEVAKKAGVAASESVLRELMPGLQVSLQSIADRLDRMDQRLNHVERSVDQLRLEFKDTLNDRFEQMRDVINEVGQRIARVEGKLEAYMGAMDRQSDRMETWLERLITIEKKQASGRRGRVKQ